MKQQSWRINNQGRRVYRRVHLGIPFDFIRIPVDNGTVVYKVRKWDALSMQWFNLGVTALTIRKYLKERG